MKPANQVSLYVSSRTDSGVHTLSNSAHFDLQRRDDRPPLSEEELLAALNYHLRSEEIRITRVQRVPAHFHGQRRTQARTYVYRLAQADPLRGQLPLTEDRLCWAPPPRSAQLDVEAMCEAAALLVGKHDFSTFRVVNTDMPYKSPIKTLSVAHIEPGNTFAQTHFHRDIRFWELTFKGRSFLYKQVRRMTGALVAGQLSVAQLRALLEARDTLAYPADLLAPLWGLFLTRVDYNQSDLQFPEEGEEGSLPPHGNPED
ncbi:hypothetical protein CRUP_031938 [Coryphaenoides rupestris]|nr:hypothetical protein CRUP_031938 [Coryphaenoides rupestris]